jgi:hypothetical protein
MPQITATHKNISVIFPVIFGGFLSLLEFFFL